MTFYAPDMGTYELDDFDLSGTITISKDGTVRLGGSMFEGASGLTDQLKDYNGAYALVENGQVHTTFTIKNGQLVMDYIGDGSDEDRYTLFCDKM